MLLLLNCSVQASGLLDMGAFRELAPLRADLDFLKRNKNRQQGLDLREYSYTTKDRLPETTSSLDPKAKFDAMAEKVVSLSSLGWLKNMDVIGHLMYVLRLAGWDMPAQSSTQAIIIPVRSIPGGVFQVPGSSSGAASSSMQVVGTLEHAKDLLTFSREPEGRKKFLFFYRSLPKKEKEWLSTKDILHHACRSQADTEILKLLLDAGSDINGIAQPRGVTPAHVAIQFRNLELLRYLASQPGFDPNAVDSNGESLFEACLKWENLWLERTLMNLKLLKITEGLC